MDGINTKFSLRLLKNKFKKNRKIINDHYNMRKGNFKLIKNDLCEIIKNSLKCGNIHIRWADGRKIGRYLWTPKNV